MLISKGTRRAREEKEWLTASQDRQSHAFVVAQAGEAIGHPKSCGHFYDGGR